MTDTTTSADPGTDPRRLLVDWANRQDSWTRRLVGQVVATRRPIGRDETDELFEFFLAEKGFTAETPQPEPKLDYATDESTATDALRLVKLSGVTGVNALTPGYEIEFSPGLTILFGENGTGKTGYARILKRLAAVRQAEDIIQDINSKTSTTPHATIDYELGGQAQSLAWKDEVGVPPFTRMSVFDSPAVNLHVDENLSYIYTPADLSLFSYVTAGLRSVQERAASTIRELSGTGNPFLRYFERGGAVYAAIETVGASTDLAALEGMADLPSDPPAEKAALEREVAALRTNAAEGILAGHREAVRTLEALDQFALAALRFDQQAFNEQIVGLAAVRESYRRVREETFGPNELPGAADDEWQRFIGAAAAYQDHLGLEGYPHVDDLCIYCRQKLDFTATALVTKYATFLDNALADEVLRRQRELSTTTAAISGLRTDTVSAMVVRQRESGGTDAVYGLADDLVKAIVRAQDEVAAGRALQASTIAAIAQQVQVAAVEPLRSHRSSVEQLSQQLADRRTALAQSEAKLADLTARMELDRHLPEIRVYVERSKRAARLGQVVGRIPSILRSLTDVSKIASEEMINHDFEQRFAEECRALRAPKVQLDFVGREGKPQRRKTLAVNYRLSQILAEGEQKVLALADFIAEAQLSGMSAPIVFDDPVNSLDHRRLDEVAARIASLVATRQVVVFTHNIWLATKLLEAFEKRKDECVYFSVTDDATTGAKGRIDRAGGPRWDTEKDLAKKVRELLTQAGKSSGEVQTALVESAYGVMRSWCEVVVEQVLFASVSQRYRANVMMGRLKEVRPDRLQPAIDVIGAIFDRACGFIPDHSQPLERLSTRPSLADAQADWSKLEDALKQYRA